MPTARQLAAFPASGASFEELRDLVKLESDAFVLFRRYCTDPVPTWAALACERGVTVERIRALDAHGLRLLRLSRRSAALRGLGVVVVGDRLWRAIKGEWGDTAGYDADWRWREDEDAPL